MAKSKNTQPDGQEATTPPVKPCRKWRYTGPFHVAGIVMPGEMHAQKLYLLTDEEVENWLKKYPDYSGWFTPS